jgi:hypothetical protein
VLQFGSDRGVEGSDAVAGGGERDDLEWACHAGIDTETVELAAATTTR